LLAVSICRARAQNKIIEEIRQAGVEMPHRSYSGARHSGAARMRMPGRRGGRIGGGKGVRSGSMFGCRGASRLKGLMMIGGMVGGADGGPFGPPPAQAE